RKSISSARARRCRRINSPSHSPARTRWRRNCSMAEFNDLARVYAETLVEVGGKFPDVVVVDADLPDSCGTELFRRRFPDRAWDIGIAEQSLPSISAGIAMGGL